MNEKLIQFPKQEPLQRYQQILTGTMIDGDVRTTERALLKI